MTLVPLGLFSHMLFLFLNFQDPLAFMTVQSAWGRQTQGPVTIIWNDLVTLWQQNFSSGEFLWRSPLDLLALLLVVGMTMTIWRRLGEGYTVYTLTGILIPASSATMSLMRYALVMFPVFMILAWWGRYPLVNRVIMTCFGLLLGIFVAIFVNWIFLA
jgi:hypothetical protein